MTAAKPCTDPAHWDEPALAFHGTNRTQCPICGGERLTENPDLASSLYDHAPTIRTGGVFGGTTAHSPDGAFVIDPPVGGFGVGHDPGDVIRDAVTRGPGPLPQSAITRVVDETHTWPAHGWPKAEGAALAAYQSMVGEVPTFVDGAAATDWILAETKRRAEADYAAREAQCKEWLTAKVRENIALHLDGHRAMAHGPAGNPLAADAYGHAADAAVEVFLQFLREPPALVEHADGTTEIREENR